LHASLFTPLFFPLFKSLCSNRSVHGFKLRKFLFKHASPSGRQIFDKLIPIFSHAHETIAMKHSHFAFFLKLGNSFFFLFFPSKFILNLTFS
jgi:hypothetical protein